LGFAPAAMFVKRFPWLSQNFAALIVEATNEQST
jgi:hypothetical protein